LIIEGAQFNPRRNYRKIEEEEKMKKLVIVVSMLTVLLSLTGMAVADDGKSAASTIEDIKNYLGLSVYLQGGYTYNFNDPSSGENDFRVFDHKANSFTLDLAQLVFTKDAPVGGIGYKLKLSAGETAKWIHSNGLGVVGEDAFDLTEAYINYVAPIGKGLKLQFGKFVTMHGAEVIEAKDDMNYSRSFLFNYAIPFTHTGFMAGYAFSDQVTVNVHFVNGWDNTDDNNSGKTGGFTLAYNPMEQIGLTFNLMYGPEKDNNNHDQRFLFDWVGTFKPIANTTVVLNTDYASEQHSAADGGSAKWYGIAGYVKYDFCDYFSTAVRAEYFDDKDGIRTGTPQKLKEITLTPEFRVAKAVIVRPEYRHDWSDKDTFNSGTDKSQDTIALGVMYTW
jgi:hypothetical protein